MTASRSALIMRDASIAPADKPVENFRPFVVLATRFAMAVPYAPASSTNSREAMDAWLGRRIPLFNACCRPAILRQTRRPDLWMLGARWDLVEYLRTAEIATEAFMRIVPQRAVIRTDAEPAEGARRFRSADKVFASYVMKKMPKACTHAITIRLDSDDVLHPAYVETIVAYCEGVIAGQPDIEDCLLSVPFGVRSNGTICSVVIYANGPFQARLEAASLPRIATAYAGNHTRFFEHDHARVVMTTCPMWMQMIHDHNVSSAINPLDVQFGQPNNLHALFGIPDGQLSFGQGGGVVFKP